MMQRYKIPAQGKVHSCKLRSPKAEMAANEDTYSVITNCSDKTRESVPFSFSQLKCSHFKNDLFPRLQYSVRGWGGCYTPESHSK